VAAELTRDSRLIRRNGREFSATTVGDRWYGDIFWDAYEAGDWEPHTVDLFERYLGQTTTFVDVGAAIGATALYAASLAKRVVALVPMAGWNFLPVDLCSATSSSLVRPPDMKSNAYPSIPF
jgi:hypothetical protein